jgi:hypothetical protein
MKGLEKKYVVVTPTGTYTILAERVEIDFGHLNFFNTSYATGKQLMIFSFAPNCWDIVRTDPAEDAESK